MGKTASGKSAIQKKLVKQGFHKIVAITTRSMRQNERQGEDYNFITQDEFIHKIESGYFAEWKSYEAAQGTWYYGYPLEVLLRSDNKTVIVLTPNGYKDVMDKLKEKPTVLYIHANNSTIRKRLLARGDDKSEAERRIKSDNEDFRGVKRLADRTFYNNDKQDMNKLVNEIIKYINEKGNR